MKLFYTLLCITIFSSGASCLVNLKHIDFDQFNLAKRQAPPSPASSSGSSNHPHVAQVQSKKRKIPTSSLPETDQKALHAAEMFLNNDNISLQQALDNHMSGEQGGSRSASNSGLYSHHSIHHGGIVNGPKQAEAEPKLFTNEVLHRTDHYRPKGYDSVRQVAARHAETLVKKGKHTEKEARKLGKAKVERKNSRRVDLMAKWTKMADTNPSLARHETANVPYRIAKHRYVALRSHQLNHQGKAENMDIARTMAKTEIDNELARKYEVERKRQIRLRQNNQR